METEEGRDVNEPFWPKVMDPKTMGTAVLRKAIAESKLLGRDQI